MRKKPIPSPIARPSDVGLAPRALSPVRPRAVLPTVAALLAMAAIGCDHSSETIQRDERMAMTLSQSDPTPHAPRKHDPSEPLPALGVLEDPPPAPPPPSATPTPPPPPKHPYPVKGGMKAVHPISPPPPVAAAGGMKPALPPTPIAPIKKPVKLGGDVAPAYPETT